MVHRGACHRRGRAADAINIRKRGLSSDSFGDNRNVNVSYATLAERRAANPLTPNDPDVMAGTANIAAPDGPEDDEQGTGFLWNAALRAGLSLRNYGFFVDLAYNVPELPDPFSTNPAHGRRVCG